MAALDARTGNELWRWYAIPKPGEPGSETWKDKNNAWKTGGGGLWQTGSYDPATRLTIWGTGNPVPQYDPSRAPATTSTPTPAVALDIDTGKLVWHFQYTPNDSWDYDEVGIHMLYDVTINGETRKVVSAISRRNGFFYSLDRGNGSFIKGSQYVERAELDQGARSQDRQAGRIRSAARRAEISSRRRAALRGDGMKRTCPTWHGGVAHQPTAYNPVKQHRLRRRHRRLLHARTALTAAFKGPGRRSRPREVQQAHLYQRSLLRLDAPPTTPSTTRSLAKAVTDIEIRSGALVTAGGLVFTALQDGWVVAYDDEKLEELWRFNVGTPLKGAPVTYAIGPKQYLAVQSSGRHLHPVKYDNLESSSYLFDVRA